MHFPSVCNVLLTTPSGCGKHFQLTKKQRNTLTPCIQYKVHLWPLKSRQLILIRQVAKMPARQPGSGSIYATTGLINFLFFFFGQQSLLLLPFSVRLAIQMRGGRVKKTKRKRSAIISLRTRD